MIEIDTAKETLASDLRRLTRTIKRRGYVGSREWVEKALSALESGSEERMKLAKTAGLRIILEKSG